MDNSLFGLYNLFDKKELELEGYCEYIACPVYDDNDFMELEKIYIFYVNSKEAKYTILFSKDFELLEIKSGVSYTVPDEMLNTIEEELEIKTSRYFSVNFEDYLDRKLITMTDTDTETFFYFYDIVIYVNKTKKSSDVDVFTKNNRLILPCDFEKFMECVIYSKRVMASVGSLEEKLYHYDEVSKKESELFYKNKKPKAGGPERGTRAR